MLGKARDLNIRELKAHDVAEWFSNNPDAEILDIKYAVTSQGWAHVLIIYKEAPHE